MFNPRSARQGYATGIIIAGEQTITLTVPSALLVFDAMAWAQSQKELHLERGEEALAAGDTECAEEDFEVARELECWMSDPRSPVRSVPLLALRQTVQPYQV